MHTIFLRICQLLLVTAALLFVEIGHANAIKESSLEEKVKRSDIVLIGRVTSISESFCFKEFRCADVQMLEVLKGKKNQIVRVLWDGPIAEFNPACCALNAHYLFFLKRRKNNFYETVNAFHGVYELPKAQAIPKTP
jgi:hypothetical protein